MVCSHMLFRCLITPQSSQRIVLSDVRFEREVKITETVLFGQAFEGVCFEIVYILLQILLRFLSSDPLLTPF